MAPSSTQPERTKVFISYSHTDVRFLRQLQKHLTPYQREGLIDCWDDTRITAGANWREAIRQALASARVAVLLISIDFLASEFITTYELPALLTAAEREGVTILPVVLRPCHFETTEFAKFQAVRIPDAPFRPLTAMKSSAQKEELWMQVAKDIERAVHTPQPPTAAIVPPGSAEARSVSKTTVPPLPATRPTNYLPFPRNRLFQPQPGEFESN